MHILNGSKTVKRIKERAAFTLGEALVAVLILLLASSIVAAGIPAAIRAYDNVVIASNAEVLLSTAMSSLRNELSMAKDIKVLSDGKTITYYSQASDSKSKIYIGTDSDSNGKDNIMYQKYAGEESTDDSRLVSREASDKNKDLHVVYSGAEYENGLVKITGLKVIRKDGSDTPAQAGDYEIRVIADHHFKNNE